MDEKEALENLRTLEQNIDYMQKLAGNLKILINAIRKVYGPMQIPMVGHHFSTVWDDITKLEADLSEIRQGIIGERSHINAPPGGYW